MSPRRTIFLCAGIVAALGVGAVIFDAWRTYTRELEVARRETQNLVTVLEDHTARTVQAVDEAVDAIAANSDSLFSPGTNPSTTRARLEQHLANLPQLLWFSVFDASGKLISSSTAAAARLADPAARPWFRRHLQAAAPARAAGRSRVGGLTRGKVSGRWFIPITRAVRSPDGSLRGVILAALDPRYFSQLYRNIDVRKHGNVTLFEANGTIVARYPDHDGFVGRSARTGVLFRDYLPKAPRGVIRLNTVRENRDILLAYRTVADYPLVINVAFDLSDILRSWWASLPVYALVGLAILAFALIAASSIARADANAKALMLSRRETEIAQAAERRIAKIQEGLATAQRIARMGSWDWNIVTSELSWSDEIYRIFGLEPQQFGATYAAFLARVHPDDRAMVEESVRRAVDERLAYGIDHRIVRPSGEVRIVHEQGEVEYDADGRPQRMTGTVQDVTEQRATEMALRENREMLAGILNISPEAVIVADSSLRITLFSRGAQNVFGYAPEEIIGEKVDRLMPARLHSVHAHHVERFAGEPDASRQMGERSELVGLRKNGEEFAALASISKLPTPGGDVFTVILRDITAQKAAAEELLSAKLRAEESSASKSRFVANMSHELRTPLNAIIGFSQLLMLHDPERLGPDRYRQYAADIHDSGQHLLAIINDILDVSRIEAGKTELADDDVAVSDLLESSARMVLRRAYEAGIDLRIIPAVGVPPLRADARLLKQVLLNILSNAVKFTPAGGRIEVFAKRPADGGVEIVVRDTGIGMTEDEVGMVGQPFVQVDNRLERKYEGTGLGLAIAKGIVGLHGGSLTIASVPRQGTSVSIRLPPERVRRAPVLPASEPPSIAV